MKTLKKRIQVGIAGLLSVPIIVIVLSGAGVATSAQGTVKKTPAPIKASIFASGKPSAASEDRD